MSRPKDSVKVPEPAASDPPQAVHCPPPLPERLRAFAAKDDVLAQLRSQREAWELQGLSEVPAPEKSARRRRFSTIAKAWPGALADISRFRQEQLRDRAAQLRALAERLEASNAAKIDGSDVELVRDVLRCEAWRTVLQAPTASDRSRKERVHAEMQRRLREVLTQ